jgi:septum site-determining protein MinD
MLSSQDQYQAKEFNVAKIVVVTSGKGGVGKTTTSASFATGLALRGYKTVVVDFDVGLRNLDLIMGCERRVVYDLVNVIHNEARLSQALIRDREIETLYILPASQTRDKDALTDEGVARVIEELSAEFDYIVCDSPAGIERGAILAMYHADEALIVTNPEISSVRDSDRIIGMLHSKTKKVEQNIGRVREHLVITRFDPDRASRDEMMTIDDISKDILKVPTLGVIPECTSVLNASNQGVPTIRDMDSKAGQAYDDLVARFLGEDRPYRHIQPQKQGWLARFFGVQP